MWSLFALVLLGAGVTEGAPGPKIYKSWGCQTVTPVNINSHIQSYPFYATLGSWLKDPKNITTTTESHFRYAWETTGKFFLLGLVEGRTERFLFVRKVWNLNLYSAATYNPSGPPPENGWHEGLFFTSENNAVGHYYGSLGRGGSTPGAAGVNYLNIVACFRMDGGPALTVDELVKLPEWKAYVDQLSKPIEEVIPKPPVILNAKTLIEIGQVLRQPNISFQPGENILGLGLSAALGAGSAFAAHRLAMATKMANPALLLLPKSVSEYATNKMVGIPFELPSHPQFPLEKLKEIFNPNRPGSQLVENVSRNNELVEYIERIKQAIDFQRKYFYGNGA